MIEIVTLFLGLVTGPQPVELAVREGVARVEARLDGEVVERLSSPPWRVEVDLGEALAPHELVAVAFDTGGRELERARRWINIDMPRGEVDGRAPPGELTSLPIDVPRAQVDGPPPPGGLTLLPVVLAAGTNPSPAEMGPWFEADGEPLTVRGVHRGPAEVLVVQDPATRFQLEELGRFFLGRELDRLGISGKAIRRDSADWSPELLRMPLDDFRDAAMELFDVPVGSPESRQLDRLWRTYHAFADLGPETTVRFISPLAAPVSTSASQRNLFAGSAGVANVGFFWLVENVPPMGFARRIADAVAIAGREAHAGGRRRAVVLLLADDVEDQSLHAASAVRAYLRALRVPLFVWALSADATETEAAWGEATFIGLEPPRRGRSVPEKDVDAALDRFARAAEALRRELDRQRIVVLGGERLPDEVELGPAAEGVRPAGLGAAVAVGFEGLR